MVMCRHLPLTAGKISKKDVSEEFDPPFNCEGRAARLEHLHVPPEEERVLVATRRYIGEGFDDARLDAPFLAMPVLWKGALAQYLGRLHRLYPRSLKIGQYIGQILSDL
jgi:hypothetical protein